VTAVSAAAPSDTLVGASSVAVGLNDQFVYVLGQGSETLTVLERDPSTDDLTWVETLQQGLNGAKGLSDATDLIVSSDGQYVDVTGAGTDNSLAVYGVQSDGTLILAQIATGLLGLDDPTALAGDPSDGNVYVASGAGTGVLTGGLASFTPAPGAPPATLTVSYSACRA
jgi:6-phosphogluconolactonase (cycloisomerase 2 family)